MSAILGYVRVSTGDQDVTSQLRRLEAAGATRIFEDVGSGRRFDRPGLTALLDYARRGDVLCVVRLDRLGRSLRELLETVDRLKVQGVGLRSLEEKLDTASAAGELVFHVFGAIAHFERRLIAERTRDGLAAEGRRPGRPPLDPAKLAAALALIEAGLSPTTAARQLGLGRSTLYRALAARPAVGSRSNETSTEEHLRLQRHRREPPAGRARHMVHRRRKAPA
jgi:DNA invertase Pin-like site-specific DNA recombinase